MATGGLGEHGNVTGGDPLYSQGSVVVNTNTSMLATVNVRAFSSLPCVCMLIYYLGRLEHHLAILDRPIFAFNTYGHRCSCLVWRRVPAERGLQRCR